MKVQIMSLRKYLSDVFKVIRGRSSDSPIPREAQITPGYIRHIVARPDPVILEIGCNDGTNTKWFLENFDQPRVFCFEPDPRAIRRFQQRINDTRVQLFECALSDHDGEITFYMSGGRESDDLPDGWDLSGSIRKPKAHLVEHPWCKFDRQITVQTMTLDSWCRANGVQEIDFIWMDVQGAEIDVIRGGTDALRQTRFLYTEYNDKELYEGQFTLQRLLESLPDFKVLIRYPDDILLQNIRFI